MRYFADYKGESVQLKDVHHDGAVSTSAKHFKGKTPDGTTVTADRKVEFKSNPSLHACGPRCQNATGHQCECSCQGKNHGKGFGHIRMV
jgi:hypothetical protein